MRMQDTHSPALAKLICTALAVCLVSTFGCGKKNGGDEKKDEKKAAAPKKDTPKSDAPKAGTDTSEKPQPTEGWGTLKGKFVLKGTAPTPAILDVSKEQYCIEHKPVLETLLVGEGNGLKNVVIVLDPKRGQKLRVHEDMKKLAERPVVLDNEKCRFEPHIVPLWTQQTLVVTNSDPVGHNTRVEPTKQDGFNQTLAAGAKLEEQFEEEERLPVAVSCTIHPWMKGFLVIKDHPYMAVTGDDGSFELKNLPAGTWRFMVWHEKPGYIQSATVDGQSQEWKFGRVEFEIPADGTKDLGEIQIAVEDL